HEDVAQTVDPGRIAQRHEIEPAAPAPSTGHGAVLATELDHPVAICVVELGGEGAGPHPGDVGLGDADHLVDVPGADSGADDCTACGGGDRKSGEEGER